jgi:hypothetical protein
MPAIFTRGPSSSLKIFAANLHFAPLLDCCVVVNCRDALQLYPDAARLVSSYECFFTKSFSRTHSSCSPLALSLANLRLNSVGLIWCMNCPTGYSGDRCERAPASTTGKQSCTPPVTGGACQNGSQCKLNSAGYIYCTGKASQQPSNEAVHAKLVKLSTSVLTLWCLSTALRVV